MGRTDTYSLQSMYNEYAKKAAISKEVMDVFIQRNDDYYAIRRAERAMHKNEALIELVQVIMDYNNASI